MESCYRGLCMAIILRAVKDYLMANEGNRKVILKDLRSEWCEFISNGLSLVIAEKLEKSPSVIKARLKKMEGRMNFDEKSLKTNIVCFVGCCDDIHNYLAGICGRK